MLKICLREAHELLHLFDCDLDVRIVEVFGEYRHYGFSNFPCDMFYPVRCKKPIGFTLEFEAHIAGVHNTLGDDVMFVELYGSLI